MAIDGIIQPEVIEISQQLRLITPTEEEWKYAIPWYENAKIMYYVNGYSDKVYNIDDINNMYHYLKALGELYFRR